MSVFGREELLGLTEGDGDRLALTIPARYCRETATWIRMLSEAGPKSARLASMIPDRDDEQGPAPFVDVSIGGRGGSHVLVGMAGEEGVIRIPFGRAYEVAVRLDCAAKHEVDFVLAQAEVDAE